MSFSNHPGREAYVLVLSTDNLTVATELKDHKQPNLQMMLRGIVNLMGAHNVMDCCENGIRSIQKKTDVLPNLKLFINSKVTLPFSGYGFLVSP